MHFGSSLFWYKIIFIVELIVSESLFVCRLNRRENFVLRAVLCTAGLLSVAFVFPIVAFNAAWASFMFVSMFLCTLGAVKICFNESLRNIVFCGIAAYTVEHLAYILASSVDDLILGIFDLTRSFDPYSGNNIMSGEISTFISLLTYAAVYFVAYWGCYYIYADRIQPHEDLRLGRTHFVILAGIIIFVDIIFNLIAEYNDNIDVISLWMMRGYNFLTCLLALQLQFTQLNNKEVKTELDDVKRLMHEQQRQYELTKQNIDIINIKSHDLKYQIRTLMSKNSYADENELREIDRALQIYQSVVKTGNEALDVILTEKSLFCEKNNITLTCIIDGKQLDFMRSSDIYALFGNALDNAVEAVKNLDVAKRNIGISVKRIENMISVHVENYFDSPLELQDGLPRTTKEDKEFHGFGMISIKSIVQKYKGTLTVKIVKNTFNLNMIFTETT